VRARRADALVGELVEQSGQALVLATQERMVGARRRGVGRDAFELEPRRARDGRGQLGGPRRLGTETPHARVDHEVHAHPSTLTLGLFLEAADAVHGVDARAHVVTDDLRHLVRDDRAQDEDRLLNAGGAQLKRLLAVAHAEAPEPGLTGQAARHGDGAVPVGVGLDHRQHLAARLEPAADAVEVALQRRQVDVGPDAMPCAAHEIPAPPWAS
jgi:hypothetical protein